MAAPVVHSAPTMSEAMASQPQKARQKQKSASLVDRVSEWERTWIMIPMQCLRVFDAPSRVSQLMIARCR